jgi:hypothetical protein
VNPASGREGDGPIPPSGPALHAHLPDCTEPDWRADPVIRPDNRSGWEKTASSHLRVEASLGSLPINLPPLAAGQPGGCQPWPAARGGNGLRLIERWNC